MQFDRAKFYHFCKQLKIETKEQGMRILGNQLLGTQTYVMDEVARGLAEDKHFFVVLKGRQLGITTISLALDLYWHFIHPGMQGTLTTDTEENREQFRSTLQMYMDGLPKEYKIPLMSHNRNQMVLRNRSRLFYQVAGIRAKGGLGRGKGITFLHGTETSSWGDEEGLASLLASLAETNPLRYYMFESTARGFNMFHDMWTTAKRARTQKAIFVGWWRNQFYSADPDSDIYKVYWDGKLSPEEARQTMRRFKENFSGTDNAGSIIIQFNDPNETPSIVNNLTPSDFDKQFDILNKTVQQEILMAHRVTSPMLFGIKTEGQLGGRSELIEAYEAFQTSYIEPRQNQMDRALTSIFKYITPVKLITKNKPPIGLDYVMLFEKGIISQAEARKEMGMTETVQFSKQSCSCSTENPFNWDDDRDLEVFSKYGESAEMFEAVPMQFASALELIICVDASE